MDHGSCNRVEWVEYNTSNKETITLELLLVGVIYGVAS
jgi:hypothetical protein